MKDFRLLFAVVVVMPLAACGPGKTLTVGDSEIDRQAAQVAEAQQVRVIAATGLRLRTKPTKQAPTIVIIPNGEAVEILKLGKKKLTIGGRTGRWVRLRFESYQGWAFSAFLSGPGLD